MAFLKKSIGIKK